MLSIIRRAAPTLVMAAILVGAAAQTLGSPDMAVIRDYLSGGYQTDAAAIAVVSALVWVLIGAAVVTVLVGAARSVASDSQFMRRRWTRAMLFLAAGAIVFGVGLAHHATSGYSMCCGDVQEAQQLAK